ncbi:MAG: pentapeptide repeat-containing protein [Rhodospirillales bacterium]|nr:pentapeptide repeat-containing protein [Rhodospirillales bacterium]
MINLPESTQFWLALLNYPVDAQQRIRIWNGYLAWKLPRDFRHQIRNVGNPPFNQYERAEHLQLAREERRELDALAKRHGGHPSFSESSIGPQGRFMDFSDHNFDDEVCFAGRILIRAKFSRATFGGPVDFRNSTFVDMADFDQAIFKRRSRFDNVTWENTVYFKEATFMETTVFNNCAFKVAAYFDDSKFLPIEEVKGQLFGGVGFEASIFTGAVSFERVTLGVSASFESAKFQGTSNFRNTKCQQQVAFQRATFDRVADFSCAKFKRDVRFHNATFNATTHFRYSEFLQPPEFFETDLHEDTDFGGVKWRKAESCYSRSWWAQIASVFSRGESTLDLINASSAIQAWDRLALIMSQSEKLPERHEFYRLRMRAQRRRDGVGILSLANWLFDILCDYGWSVKKALFWWATHFIGMSILYFSHVKYLKNNPGQMFWDCLGVSFSNAHVFFGLTSEGGHLYGARERLEASTLDASMLSIAGATQTVIGPILLFLLLLTLRNRFRLR